MNPVLIAFQPSTESTFSLLLLLHSFLIGLFIGLPIARAPVLVPFDFPRAA
jgi:hypothetical protein